MELTAEELTTIARAPTPTAKVVALCIMDLHENDGLYYLEPKDIAGFLGVCTRTVQRALESLIEADILVNLDDDEDDPAGLYMVTGDRANEIKRARRAEQWLAE